MGVGVWLPKNTLGGGCVTQVSGGRVFSAPCQALTYHLEGQASVCWSDFLRGYELFEGGICV